MENEQNTTVAISEAPTTMDAATRYMKNRERFERRQKSNMRYRQTVRGWLRNYYSRLKSRAHEVTTCSTSEEFVRASEMSNSLSAAWYAYVGSGFKRSYAPKLQGFTTVTGCNLPALFYA